MHRMHDGMRQLLSLVTLAVMIACSMTIEAQQYLGTISGEVLDASGAKVPGATVQVTELRTHFTKSVQTNSVGLYTIPFLQPGTYTLRATAPGFATVEQANIELHAGDTKGINLTAAIASTSQTVDVSTAGVDLETSSATISNTISVKEVTDLPNIGRNPLNVNTLAPGVYSGAFQQTKTSFSSQPFGGIASGVVVNGIHSHSRLVLNGIPDEPPERGTTGNYTGFSPSPEAVQEVTVQSAVYDAQYGRSAGAFTNTVLRTGANKYHGAAYYVFQNTYLNANTYERQGNIDPTTKLWKPLARTNNQWNQPGFVIDGPLSIPKIYNGHDKTFFMVAFERVQNNLAVFYTGDVPTAKMRNGDFSELLDSSGGCPTGQNYRCLYDPTSNPGGGARSLFANNDLSARGNPVGMALIRAYPMPNATGTGLANLVGNYVSTQTSSPDAYYSIATRIDHKFNEHVNMNAVYIRNRRTQSYSNQGYGQGGGPGYTHTRNNEGGSLDVIISFSPRLVLDSHVGGIYHPFTLSRYGYSYPLTSLGFPSSLTSQLPVQAFPGVSFTGDTVSALTSGQSQYSTSTLIHATELLSQVIGRHNIKYGIEYEGLRYNVNSPTSGLGSFSFNRGFTQQDGLAGANSQANSGYGLASLWLGYAYSGSQPTNIATALQQHYFAGFVQDEWHTNNWLTLSLGLRYDLEQPFTERADRINRDFCIECVSPLNIPGMTLHGGLLFADSKHRFPYRMQRNLFQPRVGAVLQLNRHQVLRAGFGLMYFQSQDLPTTLGFSSVTTYPATVDGYTPYTSLSDPYPSGLVVPPGGSDGLLTQLGGAVTYQSREHAVPKTWQSSLSLQTEFPSNIVLDVAFTSNVARDMERTKDINTLPAQYVPLGDTYLKATVPNPMAGFIPANASLNGPIIQRQQLLRPFPQFTTVNETSIPTGLVNYFAMQDRLIKRFAHGLAFQANFTWQKTMTNDYINDTDPDPTYYQDNIPSLMFNATTLYQLPKFTRINRFARYFIGDWQANFVVRAQDGLLVANPSGALPLLDPSIGVKRTYKQTFNNCYLDSHGNPVNCSSGLPPAFQQVLSTYYFKTLHPYMDHVRNITKPKFDVSMFKKFHLHESATFEIRGEFFNVLNAANFGQPNTTLTANFGVVLLTQVNDPRTGQLTARFNF